MSVIQEFVDTPQFKKKNSHNAHLRIEILKSFNKNYGIGEVASLPQNILHVK